MSERGGDETTSWHTTVGRHRRDAVAGPTAGPAVDRYRLLFIADMEVWPLHSGIHQRLYRLSTGLAALHDVTLVSLSHHRRTRFPGSERFEAVHTVAYDSCRFGMPHHVRPGEVARARTTLRTGMPELVRGWHSDELAGLIAELHATRPFDAAWVSRGYFAEHAFAAGLSPVVVDLADIDSVLLEQERPPRSAPARRIAHRFELEAVRRWERSIGRRAAAIAVCKPDDADHLRGSGSAVVVPNAVEVPSSPATDGERPDEILFVGSLDWQPNIDAVTTFADRVLPRIRAVRPSARFVVAGKLPTAAVRGLDDGDGCLVVADPPDLDELYRRATFVVVPMRLGSGTRLKVLEALAHRKALVATSVGVEGIGLTAGTHFLRADVDEEFAAASLTLFADAGLRRRLGDAGQRWVTGNARWDTSVARADETVRSAIGR